MSVDTIGREGMILSEGPRNVKEIKADKRNREVKPVAGGVTRRQFLTYLGAGSTALAAASAGVAPKSAEAQEFVGGASTPYKNYGAGSFQPAFGPIAPTDADELILPAGFAYDIVRRWGEPVTSDGGEFGFNCDYVAYFPIDALQGGRNSYDGLLFVSHEYVDPKWVSGYGDEDVETEKTVEQINTEKAAVGGSVFRVICNAHGNWEFVADEDFNRRIDATTPMDVTGPAAGSEAMLGASEVIGTLANCSGGVTPWNTVLTCEENFQDYYGEFTDDEGNPQAGSRTEPEDFDITVGYRWQDAPEGAQPPEHYGWVVEVDPFDKDSKPRKHSWLGRIRHENVAMRISDSGRVVAYTGHDENDECIYKFISSGAYDPHDREANMDLLADGMLYVADFSQGRWVALDYENNSIFRENGFAGQADVLVRAPEAAALIEEEDGPPLGTPLDRCEDIEVQPRRRHHLRRAHQQHGPRQLPRPDHTHGRGRLRSGGNGVQLRDLRRWRGKHRLLQPGQPRLRRLPQPLDGHRHLKRQPELRHLQNLQEQRDVRDALRERHPHGRAIGDFPVRQRSRRSGNDRTGLHPRRRDIVSCHPAPRRGVRERGEPEQHLAPRRRLHPQAIGRRDQGFRLLERFAESPYFPQTAHALSRLSARFAVSFCRQRRKSGGGFVGVVWGRSF
jgi:secreted PhoX family phosphatase